MDIANMPIVLLVVILLIIAALFFVVKSLTLPKSYFKNEKARSEIRLRLLEKEYEAKQAKNDAPPENGQ
jgi:hypothetical protein